MINLIRVFAAAVIITLPAGAMAAHVLKLATLAPQGSTWMEIVDDWSEELERESNGELKLKVYANGVAGDEPDVLRKIRFGQLHGGLFSGYGIGRIYSPARILEMPFFYEDIDEIDHVRADLMPDLEKGFRRNGFELLGWMEVGFVRFFSHDPIESLDDLRTRRIWLWQGDQMAEAFFRATRIAPIPLSIIDVFTSLSTGLVDTVYSPPLAALGMQWFTKTRYVTNIPMANGIGGVLVSSREFNRLPRHLQELLRRTGKVVGERLVHETRRDNEDSLQVLRDHGLEFRMNWEDINPDELLAIRQQASAELMRTNYIPRAMFDRVARLLAEYRSRPDNPPTR